MSCLAATRDTWPHTRAGNKIGRAGAAAMAEALAENVALR